MTFRFSKILGIFLFAISLMVSTVQAKPWKIYLLFGQSNMTGGATPGPDDVFNNSRVKVLAYNNCSGRTYNQWYTATGSLHCSNGFGIGDWFGKIVADSMTQDTLALIPCAIAGVDIDFFRKNIVSTRRNEFSIPPDNKWDGAYPWMVERLKLALQKGEMAGILLHQGEADWTAAAQKAWPGKVAEIIKDLKTDLNFGDVPLMIGELRADGAACCKGNNAYVAQAAKEIPNGHVISSANLSVNNDAYHFNAAGLREFGKRYASAYLGAEKPTTALLEPNNSFKVKPQGDWRLRQRSGLLALEFDQHQDFIWVQDTKGKRVAQGQGKKLQLPTSSPGHLLFFHSKSSSGNLNGVLHTLPSVQ